ncbi:hypothetical protein TrCOL_g4020 [Triparma columacea]|uniref:Cytidyltransferase-like domain-containing protein n=1 Tax=Triparma columacea TaxID=722753 RepID=A0A9W7GJ55_9STRA|nr:hypothetical protein TrCOL_g4020 [Triparma columacea]
MSPSTPVGIATSVIYSKSSERPGRSHKVVCVGVSGSGKSLGFERLLKGEDRAEQSREVDDLVKEVTEVMRGIKDEVEDKSGAFEVGLIEGIGRVHKLVAGGKERIGMLWPYPAALGEGGLGKDVTVVPGSFNPMHVGHLEMAGAGGEGKGGTVFELSLTNVDKPPVAVEDLGYRVEEFGKLLDERGGERKGRIKLMCTAEPTFAGKVRALKELGAERITFVVGSDTFVRVVDKKYYGSEEEMKDVLEGWRRGGVSFVVCPRGEITENEYRDDMGLSRWLTKEEFWCDVSSTEIREGTKDRGGSAS